MPLSPNWRLDSKGTGVRLVPQTADPEYRHCTFEIVENAQDQSAGTVKGGDAICPFPDCGRGIDGDEIKAQAQAGRMGQQLYAIVYKREVAVTGKIGRRRVKMERGFRAPRPEDDVEAQVQAALTAKMPEWQTKGIVPDEEILPGQKTEEPRRFGMQTWESLFAPRQLYGHCVSVEVFHELVDELRREHGDVPAVDAAALAYLALAMDKMLNYNSRMSVWMPTREVVANTFNRHDFAFCWSFAEMAPTITGLGYDWAIKQTGKALKELIELVGHPAGEEVSAEAPEFDFPQPGGPRGRADIRLGSADALDLADHSVDCIVMDPPYYDNVMYAELADFFYVWLKRTAGLLWPEAFSDYLTDKDREAVANPAKFKGQKGAKKRAGVDYQQRMARIFTECRRVLKPDGIMTLMFTHKATGAWDALASGLVEAGFVITASWPVNTEAEGSLHIKEKSAARSTILLVCRPRAEAAESEDDRYWEDVEPLVRERVRQRVGEFQAAGIGGIDLYLASFGPALQVFSEAWPLKRGTPLPKPKKWEGDLFPDWDPYSARPEDALQAARAEVKRWRFEQLTTVKRQHHLDPLSEWFIMAWDAFGAPRFPADEALKLARVVGLDFDRAVKSVLCDVKGDDVLLWDSQTRHAKRKLGPASDEVMIDTLHQAAWVARSQNTQAAVEMLKRGGFLQDATMKTALEALLNVLPAVKAGRGNGDDPLNAAASDFEALNNIRKLGFSDVPGPKFEQTEALDREARVKEGLHE